MAESNEIGTAHPRGRRRMAGEEAEDLLRGLSPDAVLPERAVVSEGPTSCPACGSASIFWGCDPDRQTKSREEIHPLAWHETEWMADSFICNDCHAGWIEPDDPEPITWVRPYWTLGGRA